MDKRNPLLFLLGLLLLPACDLGAYPRLGELRDETRLLGPGATTWVAFDSTRVTLLVLSRDDGSAPPGFALTWLGAAAGDESLTGDYRIDAAARTLTLSATRHYQSDTGSSGQGNTRTPVQQTLVFDYRYQGQQLRLSGTRVLPVLRNFQTLIAQLDTKSETGARCAVELLHLTTGSAELRMPGFGGLGTVEYTRPAVFRGQLAGSVRISLDNLLSPLTEFVYDDFSDFDGYVTNGTKATKTNTSGDGKLYGTLHFEIMSAASERDAAATPAISGAVEYGNHSGALVLEHGHEAGGAYTVSFGAGGSFSIAYDAPKALHLAQCFPP